MATGYGRQSSYTDGDVIQSDDTNNEFNQLDAAFDEDTGHAHDGTADNGAFIPLIKDKVSLTSVTANGSEVQFNIEGQGVLFTFSKGSNGEALFNGTELGNFAELGHTHVIADVTGLQSSLDSKYSSANQPDWDDIQNKPEVVLIDTTIDIDSVNGLQSSLDSKYSDSNKPQWTDILNTPNFALDGHTHEMSEITGLTGVLSLKYSPSNLPTWNNITQKPDFDSLYVAIGTTYGIGDITGLQTSLDSKYSPTNNPDYADITGKPDFDSLYVAAGTTYGIGDINGLQAELDTIPSKIHVREQFSSNTITPTPCDHYILSASTFSGVVDIGVGWPIGSVVDLYFYNSGGATVTLNTQGSMFGPMFGFGLSGSTSHTITGEALVRLVNADNTWRVSVFPIGQV